MAQSKKRAPSLWLTYTYEKPGDILMQDVLVPSSGLAKCTYYCCLNWNISREGGGYCGIQDHPEGRAFIFSIWDPQQVKDIPITAVTKGLGTWTERFGGEGTGLKSMNFELGWKEGQWYTLVVRRWDASGGQATRFGCWVHDQQEDTWTHLITMEYPVPRVYFEGVTASFLEDWGFTSEHYRGGFKRQVDKTWTPFSKAEFKVNMYDVSNGTATTNFEAKKCSDPTEGVCIAAGGTVQGDQDTCCVFEDPAQDCRPPKKPVKLKKVETKDGVLNWVVEKGSTPQFGFRVKLADQELCCGQGEFITETRLASCVQSNEEGNGTVVVEVEDILGNCDQQSCELSRS
ncbi:uncharacterized protein LOC143280437 isoform X2 [Babylonia areolata]|uniref:uncharacterized protein LOC143280437 isoform X2 n=1 Tax=Babylonia areolata TaxID=304850 RepID=UPI003FCFC3E2